MSSDQCVLSLYGSRSTARRWPPPARATAIHARAHVRNETATREQAAVVLAQLEPDADRFGRIVLEQHRDSSNAARRERVRKGAAHHHVAGMVDLAEQAGIALDGAGGIDGGTRRENRGHGGFG